MKNVEVLVVQSCQTLCDPTNISQPGSSVHGILQARILEQIAIPFSRDLPDAGIEPESFTPKYGWTNITRYLTEVKETMMNKQNDLWRKRQIYYRKQKRTLPNNPNSYSQNCKNDSGFIKWEQGAIKGSNQRIRESPWKKKYYGKIKNFVDAKYSVQSSSASPWL